MLVHQKKNKGKAMFKFLKVLTQNICKGPATEAFPAAPAHTPERFRGRVTMNPELCVGCGICRHVCAGQAIRLEDTEKAEDGSKGYDFSIWHNSCALCGMCRHYCPTGAITLTADWHSAHRAEQKYEWAEHHFIPYLACAGCGAPIRMLPPDVATRIYTSTTLDPKDFLKLCPACRQLATARREGESAPLEEAASKTAASTTGTLTAEGDKNVTTEN